LKSYIFETGRGQKKLRGGQAMDKRFPFTNLKNFILSNH